MVDVGLAESQDQPPVPPYKPEVYLRVILSKSFTQGVGSVNVINYIIFEIHLSRVLVGVVRKTLPQFGAARQTDHIVYLNVLNQMNSL